MDAKTTPEYLKSNAVNMPDAIALSYRDESGNWVRMTWSDFYDVTMKMAKSLIAIGFEPGDNLSIYSYNRMEWYAAYAAANFCNGAAVGVYHTCSPEEVEWVVGNSDSKVVFVGTNPMDNGDPEKMCTKRLEKAMPSLEKVEAIVSMSSMQAIDHPNAHDWESFMSMGSGISDDAVMEGSQESSPLIQ